MQQFYRRKILEHIQTFRKGNVTWRDQQDSISIQNDSGTAAEIYINDHRAYKLMAKRGSIGLGESYAKGYWTTPNLRQLLINLALNIHDVNQYEKKKLINRMRLKLHHFGNRNSTRNSEANIQAHYDLGNKFFSLFLDAGMQYSCLLFANAQQSLEQAAHNKIQHIIQNLHLQPGQSVLEIGCGWGTLTMAMAKQSGAKVTALTLSTEQFNKVSQDIKSQGLEHQVTVLLEDYRSFAKRYTEKFDRIVSIEMIEAVGAKYMPAYFQSIAKLLKNDGLLFLQAITIRDQHFKEANREVDFIKRYIFPGGFLPSSERIMRCIKKHTQLNLLSQQDFGPSYDLTLQHWSDRLHENSALAEKLGYDAEFQRLWQFYLAYCQAGFATHHTGLIQSLFAGPEFVRTINQAKRIAVVDAVMT